MELLSDVWILLVPAPFLPCGPAHLCVVQNHEKRTPFGLFFKLKSESGPAEASEALCLASEGLIWTGAPLKVMCLPVSACFSISHSH